MRIEARKVRNCVRTFLLTKDNLTLSGEVSFKRRVQDIDLFLLKAKLSGDIEVTCDKSGEKFVKKIDEDLVLYIADGIWDMQSQNESIDVVEFFDGFIDLDYILQSEIDSIQLDYHIKE